MRNVNDRRFLSRFIPSLCGILALCGLLASCVEMFVPAGYRTDFFQQKTLDSRQLSPNLALFSFEGSYYDLGVKLGTSLKALGITPDKLTDRQRSAYRYQMARVIEHSPGMVEYARGLASVYGGDFAARPDEYYQFISVMKMSFACSTVFVDRALSGASNYLARNYDFMPAKLALTHYKLTGAHEVIGHSFMFGYPFLMDGMNDAGLAVVGNMEIDSTKVSSDFNYALPSFDYVEILLAIRMVLENCGSLAEAKALLSSLQLSTEGPLVHLMVADASGQSFVAEFDQARKGQAVYIDKSAGAGYQTMTNFPLHSAGWQGNLGYREGPCVRFASLEKDLAAARAGSVGPEAIDTMLGKVRMAKDNRVMNQGMSDRIDTLVRLVYDLDRRVVHCRSADDNFAVDHQIGLF